VLIVTKTPNTTGPAATPPARGGQRTSERPHAVQVRAAREQTAASLPALRNLQLLSRQEVMALTGLSYPTIWAWTQDGRFPRALKVGGKNAWRATEIDVWVNGLERRALKPIGGGAS
jgi:predicted DNA-binding transcriptional regulator AlpA